MKTNIKNASLLSVLFAVINLLPAGRVTAQTFTTLHSFTATSTNSSGVYTNSDGANPAAVLITNASGNTLYGTANVGGSSGNGLVFAVNADGTGFTNLHSFTALDPTYYTNRDGASPNGGLILSGNTLYGATYNGGTSGGGTVFAINTDGTGFTNLHSFPRSNGANPNGGLILSGSTLYGTTYDGGGGLGSSGCGTVFAVSTNGTGFTNLYSFTRCGFGNSDGANPHAGLVLSGSTLYGTAVLGGSFGSGDGTLFAVNTDGTGFTNLHNFGFSDGNYPSAGLVLSGNTLYGTATFGGSSAYYGTVFSLSFRPQLTLTRSGTNVILSWPTNVAGFDYTGYTLQSTTNMVSPAVWSSNSLAPVVISGQNTVTNPIAVAQKFYRLSQ